MATKKKDPKKKPKAHAPKSSNARGDADVMRQKPDVKVDRFRSNLRVMLSPEALAEKSDRMAHVIGEKENLVAEAKSATAHLKAQIKEKDAEIGKLSAQIRDKAEYREVECERRYHYRTGKIVEVRLDTDEVTFERAMTFSERQLDLPAKEAAKPKKSKDEQLEELGDKVREATGQDEEAPDVPASDEAPQSGELPAEEEEDEDEEAAGA